MGSPSQESAGPALRKKVEHALSKEFKDKPWRFFEIGAAPGW